MVQTCRWNSPHFSGHPYINRSQYHLKYTFIALQIVLAVLSLTTWPLSLQVILLLSDRNQFYHPLFDWIDDFLNEPTPSKWQQGSLFVIFYNGIYIYRYTFSILQYTFIGWYCGGPAAHLHQVYVWDTPPPPGTTNKGKLISVTLSKLDQSCFN